MCLTVRINKRFLSWYFMLMFLLLKIYTPAFSQHKKIIFQSLQEGLSNHQINCILKDSEGFMWFGTKDGLDKFDGTNFLIYENIPGDSTSLCQNSVNALIEDNYKNIWIGTANGLNVYNREKDNFGRVKALNKQNILYVSSLFCDRSGILWIGTSGNGLFLYDQKKSQLIQYMHDEKDSESISSNFITCIAADTDHFVWVGTRNGLDRFMNSTMTFEHYVNHANDPRSLSSNSVTDMTPDKDGFLWIGTYGGGLDKMKKINGGYIFKHYQKSDQPGSLSLNNILSLCVDNKGNLWTGTENGGLNFLPRHSDKFISYFSEDGDPYSLSSNSIWSLYEDNTGILWIGTYNKGLNIIDNKFEKFENIQRNGFTPNTLVSNNVKNFAEDKRGYLWIATDGGGISCFNTKNRQFVNRIDNSALSSKAVMCILCSGKDIWAGTWAGGIERFNKNGAKIRNYRNEKGLGPGNNIICMYEDHNGNIWAGTSGKGLFLYDPASDHFFQITDKSKSTHLTGTAYISAIFEDHRHNIWVGTMYGLMCINGSGKAGFKFSEFLHTADPKSISSFRITDIFEDSRKKLWIGTEDGLNLFNSSDSTFTVFQQQDGLPNNSIKGILEDDRGNLWISTDKGLSKFNPSKRIFKNFYKQDGLNTNEFNIQSCIRTNSGEFFFAGNNGINAFYPDSIRFNTYIPAVYITDLKIFNNRVKVGTKGSPLKKNITETRKITLTYKQNSFTIGFVALNYTRSEENKYAYRLEGFDKNWNYVGSRRIATYTNLDPGKYVFQVKGSNNDGFWNNTPTELEINVLPPYWRTIWAYLAYLLIFSSILFGFIKLLMIKARQEHKLKLEKINREKDEELNKLKIQFFTNISHELRTPLSLILSPLEQIISIGQVKSDLKTQLKMVFRNVEKLFSLVNELMDFTKSEESRLKMMVQLGDMVKFTHEVFYLFMDEAHRRQIDYRFIAGEDKIDTWFDKSKMEKIILNLIANAFKYTPDQSRILVKVEKAIIDESIEKKDGLSHNPITNGSVSISVTDNGPGIAPEYLDKVFDRFFQGPEGDAKAETSSGIGLALVKNLVELHHGHINLTSEKWKETCFNVIIPLGNKHFGENEIFKEPVGISLSGAKPPVSASKTVKNQQEPGKHLPVVLVVEDNEELRGYIVSVLSGKYRILEAPDGETGFETALSHVPDLIISDILMPRVTGIEFCKKIKENITTSHIPVIMLTAKVALEDQIEGIESGADVYITKPFNVGYLEVTIRKQIETRRQLYRRFSQDIYIVPREISNNDLDQKFLERTISYIENNAKDQEITVEKLASYLIMNRSNFYRKIKALTGQTATEFIRTIRLKMAIKYLESREYNISEIAYEVGFDSPGYFAKCFRKQFGRSPSEYLSDKIHVRSKD